MKLPQWRLFALGVALAALPAIAAAQVTVTYLSDSRLTLNSNKPCASGPHAQYVHFRVTNTGGTTLTAPSATLSGFSNGITLGGGQPATIAFAPLAPGASWDGFWYVEYPCSIGTAAAVTVTVQNGATAVASASQTLTTYSMLAAQAGGNLVAQSLTAVTLGAISYLSVGYEFGGADAGTTYLVQPAGTPNFNAGCFQLLGSEVTAGNVTAMPVGTKNKLFYTAAAKQAGSGYQVTVRYTFRAMCAGVSTVAQPFANMLSGQQLKYSGNFDTWGGQGQSTVPGAGNPFTATKRVTPDTLSDGGTVTYTVVLRNDSSQMSTIDSIADVLPAGARYVGLDASSQITATNSMIVPAANATGRIVWRSVPGLYYPVNGRDSLVLVYRATIPAPEGTYTNSVSGYVAAQLAGTATANVVVQRIVVTVAPRDSTPIKRLVGTAYALPFTVTNGSGHAETFDVLLRPAKLSNAVMRDSMSVAGVTAPSPDSLRLALSAATPGTVRVWYTVAFGDTAAEHFTLVARAVRNPAVRDSGLAVVRRAAPALSISKSVAASGPVAPGVELTYTSTFQNAGDFAARGAAVDEALPAEVMLKLGSVVPTLPGGVASTIEYSADGGATWSYTPASGACGAPIGYDGCVTRVRLVLGSDLAPAASGTLIYVARVR